MTTFKTAQMFVLCAKGQTDRSNLYCCDINTYEQVRLLTSIFNIRSIRHTVVQIFNKVIQKAR